MQAEEATVNAPILRQTNEQDSRAYADFCRYCGLFLVDGLQMWRDALKASGISDRAIELKLSSAAQLISRMRQRAGEDSRRIKANERNQPMTRKIEAIIREDALDAVKSALHEIGIVGLNIFEVRGHGRQGGLTMSWRGTAYKMDLLPKLQLNIILSDDNLEKTVDAIIKAARTGTEGDGIIFIYPVEDVVRVRTGERGHDALMYPGDIDARKGK